MNPVCECKYDAQHNLDLRVRLKTSGKTLDYPYQSTTSIPSNMSSSWLLLIVTSTNTNTNTNENANNDTSTNTNVYTFKWLYTQIILIIITATIEND